MQDSAPGIPGAESQLAREGETLEEVRDMAEKVPSGVPRDPPGVTPEGVDNPGLESGVGNEYIGNSQPPEQPTGSVGAPGAAGGSEVPVDERGRK